MMKFENQEVMDRVKLELSSNIKLNSKKKVRCFRNYLRLMDKCYSREVSGILEFSSEIGQWHHILPRSLFPDFEKATSVAGNWNVTFLLHKEHLVAHHLLFELYERKGSMAKAFSEMCYHNPSRVFCKKSNLDALKNWSYEVSDYTRGLLSSSRKGYVMTEEQKSKLSRANKGKKLSESHKKKMSESLLGRVHSEETRIKISESHKGREKSESHKKHLSDSLKGKKFSEERKKRLSESRRGRPHVQKYVECPHCGKVGGASIMKRWHFDKCKINPENEI